MSTEQGVEPAASAAPPPLRLGTRGSRLALTQSGLVAAAVERVTGRPVELVQITTKGDRSSAPLTTIGGSGVFVTAVRRALHEGRVDLVVHSFKDLPTAAEPGLALGAVPTRADPTDALCAGGRGLEDLPYGATVGTGSPRRTGQLLRQRPDLRIVPIRGNVETRLGRVGEDLDAVILATAGLDRLGVDAAHVPLGPPDFLPAPAQGALAVECRADDHELIAALAEISDPTSRTAALAERAVLRELEAGCSAPVSAFGTWTDDGLRLVARITAPDGSRELVADVTGAPGDGYDDDTAERLGVDAARILLDAGAREFSGIDALPSVGTADEGAP